MKKLESLKNDLFQALDLEESKRLIGGADTLQTTEEITYKDGLWDKVLDTRIEF